jgi:phosphohistidine phosphatase
VTTGAGNDPPTRTLVLLRHAKSAWPDGVPDHDRPLAGRGRRDAPAAGRWLRATGHVPGQVVCSTAQRARQTWQLAESGLMEGQAGSAPRVGFERQVYGASAADLLGLIRQTPTDIESLLLVGHEPAMSGLALTLAANPAAAPAAPPVAPTAQPDAAEPDAAEPDAAEPDPAEPGAALARLRAKFPTAAIAVLELTGAWPSLAPGQARLVRFVTPRDVRASGAAGGE